MLYKKTDTDIASENIWEQDVLGRERVANEIIQIMSTIKQPFVIGVSSRYGTGKTFFATRCVAELKKRNYASVYFNAWQNDYAKEPLTGFIHTVAKALNDLCGLDDIEEATTLISRGAKFIARRALPISARVLARIAFGEELTKQLSDEIENGVINDVSRIAEQVVKDSIDGYEDTISEMETFQDALAALAIKVRQTNKNIEHDQVIVFVDELDRCRPNYTIEILESIKHLFNVKNFIFVLMSDDEAFEASVATVYSDKINSGDYLRKFVDWKVNLPDPERDAYTRYLTTAFNVMDIGWLDKSDNYFTGVETLIEFFGIFSNVYRLTLREMDQCFTSVNLVMRSCKPNGVLLPLLAYYAVLKEKNSQQYKLECLSGDKFRTFAPDSDEVTIVSELRPLMAWLVELGTSKLNDDFNRLDESLSKDKWSEAPSNKNVLPRHRERAKKALQLNRLIMNDARDKCSQAEIIGRHLEALSKIS